MNVYRHRRKAGTGLPEKKADEARDSIREDADDRGRPMTEEEWLACEDPARMRAFLEAQRGVVDNLLGRLVRKWLGGKSVALSKRRVLLFATACCRQVWDHLGREERALVEAVDANADNLASRGAIRECRLALAHNGRMTEIASELIAVAAHRPWLFDFDPAGDGTSLGSLMESVANQVVAEQAEMADTIPPVVREQATLLRDIAGNPFRPTTLASVWRTSTALALAQQMYESRDFSTMPILADALQDAGCENADVLDHCRGVGPHVRGCWVVDLVLSKE